MPPPIPFPYPLHIGTDICRVARIAHILRSKQGSRFIRRVLAPEELARAKPAIRHVLEAAAQSNGRRVSEPGAGVTGGRGQVGTGGTRDAVEAAVEGGRDGLVGSSDRQVSDVGKEVGGVESAVFGRAATYMAGRFAAKEAAFKAHPHLRLGFHDILILPSSDAQELTGKRALTELGSSAPVALIRGDGESSRDQMAKVSISHDGEYATAMCIGFEASESGHSQEPRRD
ncbi:uncharacterized protein B0H64DRAFT_399407 [Chaetomium fimeti]|uniref:4'-phosphopantetheinyl transferase domain-containing protein n=1 Tax=Chaetomium fimeti TaxID=1854472 RepID=A0AAE0LQT5_9PEZI|nr:hypothetical protein B0H64DRAFT_399407 [Chaetomium fimeti]